MTTKSLTPSVVKITHNYKASLRLFLLQVKSSSSKILRNDWVKIHEILMDELKLLHVLCLYTHWRPEEACHCFSWILSLTSLWIYSAWCLYGGMVHFLVWNWNCFLEKLASIISCSKHFRYVVPYTSKPSTPEKIGTRHTFSLHHSRKHHSYAEIVTFVMKSCRINFAFPTTNPDVLVQFIGFCLNDDILGPCCCHCTVHSLRCVKRPPIFFFFFVFLTWKSNTIFIIGKANDLN